MPKAVVKQFSKSKEDTIEEEILVPLESPEYEESLEWLKQCIDKEIASREFGTDEAAKNISLKPKSEEMKHLWEDARVKKFMEYNEFIPPNENQGFWMIPMEFNKLELKSISSVLESMIYSKNILQHRQIDMMTCKSCGNEFLNLLQHLNKSKTCPSGYSEKDMKSLKKACQMFSQDQKKKWYQKNKQQLSKKMSDYHKENREAILKRKKDNSMIRKAKERKK